MKILLFFVFVYAVAIAKPIDEVEKSMSILHNADKQETANNKQIENMKDQVSSPVVPISSESVEKERKPESNDDLNTANDEKSKIVYASAINNQATPSVYSSQLTSSHNINLSSPGRSVPSTYPSSSYELRSGSYGLGSRMYGLESRPYMLSSRPYELISRPYGLGSGSYGIGSEPYMLGSGSYGIGSEPYEIGSGPYGLESGSRIYGLGSGIYGIGSGSYGTLESQRLGVPSYSSSLNGLGSKSYGLSGLSESFSSSLPVDIPTSYSDADSCHNGINVAQQIIHKPIITELQEVIHKPIITEVQEVVNKPVISEVQQVVHKPLYTEHIDLGPSYHGYQKHIVKKPVYNKPTTNFLHQPMAHTGTVHLADEYEHAVNTPTTIQNVCPTGVGSSCGPTDMPFQTPYVPEIGSMHQNAQYGSAYSMPNEQGWPPLGISTSVPGAQSLSKQVGPASFDYSSIPSYRYIIKPRTQQMVRFNIGDEESYKNIDETSQPKEAEQITYDEFQSYKQQPNNSQQFNDNQFQQQQGRNIEDYKKIKMDVDAIDKQLKKNPEMKKQLIKLITESIGNQMTQFDENQHAKTVQ